MAAPESVPTSPTVAKAYQSPPRRDASWQADRPGEVVGGGQPTGPRLGSPGPDQGYALKLVHQFDGKLHLVDGEDIHDVESGSVAIAMRRSSIFGRAPVIHDLTIAFTVFGFLDPKAPGELVAARRQLFEGVHIPVHYVESRAVADAVHEDTLRMTPGQVEAAYQANWRDLVSL